MSITPRSVLAVRGWLPLALASACVVWVSADQQRFGTRTDVVTIDVSVVDRQGRPVRDLTVADFTLEEDGERQPIEYFRFVELPAPPPVTAAWQREIAPDVVRNNDVRERRLIVIVMDDAMMPFDIQMINSAKGIARDVIERLGQADLAAVVHTWDNRRTQNFTQDRSLLMAAIDRFTAAGYRPSPSPRNLPWEGRVALNVLFQTVETLGAIPERRKAVVYVSTGIPLESENPVTTTMEHAQQNWLLRQTVRRAQWHNVNVYSVDPGGLDGLRAFIHSRNPPSQANTAGALAQSALSLEAAVRLNQEFLEGLSEETGGRAIMYTNEFTSRIEQMLEETGTFYMLGYAMPNPEPGKYRRVSVKVNRPGLTVTARRGYYTTPDAKERLLAEGLASETEVAIAGLVPDPRRSLELATVPVAVPGQKDATVVLALRVEAEDLLAAGGTHPVDVQFSAFTPRGDARGTMRMTAQMSRRPGDGSSTFDVLGRLPLAPGRYEIRASASTPSAASGSVYGYVDVPDFARAPLSLSGLVVALEPPAAGGPREIVDGVLPVVPAVRRTFTRTDRVTGFLRIHHGSRAPRTAVQVTTQIIDAQDAMVFDRLRAVEPKEFGASRQVDHQFDVPVASLPPGTYLLRVTAASDQHTVRRDVVFTVQ